MPRPPPLILEANSDGDNSSGDDLGSGSEDASSYASSSSDDEDQQIAPQNTTDPINAEAAIFKPPSLLFGLPKISKSNSEDINDLRSRAYLSSKLKAKQ